MRKLKKTVERRFRDTHGVINEKHLKRLRENYCQETESKVSLAKVYVMKLKTSEPASDV